MVLLALFGAAPARADRWQAISLGSENLYGIFFLDAQLGWVVGANGFVRRTTTGGERPEEWLAPSQLPGLGFRLWKVFFLDSQQGWIVGDSGTLLRTLDGGNTWQLVMAPGGALRTVYFVDSLRGWMGSSSVPYRVYRTADGSVWNTGAGINGPVVDMTFLSSGVVGWAVGGSTAPNFVWETSDGGISWSLLNTFPGNQRLNAVRLEGQNGFVAVGEGGTAYRYQPPNQWTPLAVGLGSISLQGLTAGLENASQLWVVGAGGAIAHSANGGATWQSQPSGTGVELHGVAAWNDKQAWVVGDTGTLLLYRPCFSDTDCASVPQDSECQEAGECDPNSLTCGVKKPIGTPCGVCRACDSNGQCQLASDESACDDDDPCTRAGKCLAGRCIIEGFCDEILPGCPEAAVRYGSGTGRSLLCRLPPDAVRIDGGITPALSDRTSPMVLRLEPSDRLGFRLEDVLFRVSVQTRSNEPQVGWWLDSLHALGSDAWTATSEVADNTLQIRLRLRDQGGVPDTMPVVEIAGSRSVSFQMDTQIYLSVWAPCGEDPDRIGCHLGNDPPRVDRLTIQSGTMLPVQQIGGNLWMNPMPSEGCGCGNDSGIQGTWDKGEGLLFAVILVMLRRRRSATEGRIHVGQHPSVGS